MNIYQIDRQINIYICLYTNLKNFNIHCVVPYIISTNWLKVWVNTRGSIVLAVEFGIDPVCGSRQIHQYSALRG